MASDIFSSLFDIARANTANPHRTFIKDPTGSGKLVPFHLPLDLRTIEEKMGGYPFNQASLVGHEDWTINGPREQGPFPSLRNTRSIDQGKLKSLMDELQDMRRRGVL